MNKGTKYLKNYLCGFTLLEVLLVVAAISVLAGIVILAINPGKQLADTRNTDRRADVNTILNAVYQYAIDNNGSLPASVPTAASCAGIATNQICRTGASCIGLVDLSALTAAETYLVSIPTDPTGASVNETGYYVSKNTNNRVTVCAPSAEVGATISVTR